MPRTELEARMPRWRDAAAAISKLGIDLDDAEFAYRMCIAPRAAASRRNVSPVRNALLMTDPGPEVDGRHPADVVTQMVGHVLDVAATWPRWDGRPAEIPVEGESVRIYTPHKAIRRVADHLVDHLAELEARLAGRPTEPDRWHASVITTPADLAAFTSDDLDEARSRLRRLALIWDVRLRSLSDKQLDERAGDAWTLRQLAFHLAGSAFYADSVGLLAP